MSIATLQRSFQKMGAALRFDRVNRPRASFRIPMRRDATPAQRSMNTNGFSIDVVGPIRRQTFVVDVDPKLVEVEVLEVCPDQRHLLLLVKDIITPHGRGAKSRILCGHDEREWFAAALPTSAVPGRTGSVANSVFQAKQDLKPTAAIMEQERRGVRRKDLHKRKNDGFKRQGEWFFLPRPDLIVDEKLILKNEPLRMGAGKPHMASELYRVGGVTVRVGLPGYPNGVTEEQYSRIVKENPELVRGKNISTMQRNPTAYVRGTIKHSDHATLRLDGWYEVVPSRENRGNGGMVAFLD